jgi:hypothetical protein
MGWLDDWFGSGGSSQPTVVNQSNTIPGYLEDFSKEQIAEAKSLAGQEFQAFPGQMVADLTPDQLQAQQMQRGATGQWQGDLNLAGGAYRDVMDTRPTLENLTPYMNPFLESQKTAVNRNYDIAQNLMDAKAVGAGAFGGSRRGIADADLAGQRGSALSNVDYQGFMNAQNQFNRGQMMKMEGAGALTGNVGQQARLTAADIAGMQGIGGQNQMFNQMNIDKNVGEFMREQRYPIDMYNLRQSALRGAPYSTASMSTSTTPGGNTAMQTLGALGGVVSGVGGFFAEPKEGESAWTGVKNAWNLLWP